MEKYYKICGLTVKMDSFGRTVTQAQPYICKDVENPDIVITSSWKELQKRQPHLSDEDSEYMSTGASFYRQLLKFDGMLLHASAVVVDGQAYLFSANCGTGKSTHTALWRKVLGEDRVQILNDDKPALRFEDGIWYAYGTPWSGKTAQNINLRVPLKGICMLNRSEVNHIERYSGSKAIFDVFSQTARPPEVGSREKLLELMNKLFKNVPIWRLGCNMEDDAVYTSYNAMSGV